MSPEDLFVSVVIPLDNDAASLEGYLREVVAVLRGHYRDYEILLVDDGSLDGTCALVDRLLAEGECLRYLRLARRFGLDVALAAGLDSVIGDYVVVAEPGSDPPREIPRLVDACRKGSDVVIGTCPRQAAAGWLFRLGRGLFYWLCRRLITDRLPASATHFMAFSRRAVNAITRIKQRHRHLGIIACSVGYTTTLLPYQQRPNAKRSRRRDLVSPIHYAMVTLVTNSISPLRLVTYIGVSAALANLLYMLYVFAVNCVKNQVAEGWTTLSLQMSGMFFLVFLTLTVLSEYLAQTFQASQDQPLYHILEERSSVRPFISLERRNVVDDSSEGRLSA